MSKHLISIITPCYNRVDFIADAIESVLAQNYSNLEHIIIDGGSTDGTLDVLSRYPHLRVVSEPDNGMYDAINKGISKAHGDLIGVLNSDDVYTPDAFKIIIGIINSYPEIEVVWGAADMFEMTSAGENVKALLYPPGTEREIIPYLLWEIPIFNACFFHRRVFERYGLLLEQLKISGDREFMLRAALSGCRYHTTNTVLYRYFSHNDSMTYSINPAIFEQWNEEHCWIANYYLKRRGTTKNAKAAYRRMHTNSSLSLMKIAFKKRDFSKAFELALRGWQVDPRWLIIFLQRSLKIIVNGQTQNNG